MDASHLTVAASAAGAFIAGLISGRRIERELSELRAWAHEAHAWMRTVSEKLGISPPRPPPAEPRRENYP